MNNITDEFVNQCIEHWFRSAGSLTVRMRAVLALAEQKAAAKVAEPVKSRDYKAEAELLHARIDDMCAQYRNDSQTITDLRSELKTKDARIAELESQAAQPAQVSETMSLEQRANALREACESGASTSDIMQMLAEVPTHKPAQVPAIDKALRNTP